MHGPVCVIGNRETGLALLGGALLYGLVNSIYCHHEISLGNKTLTYCMTIQLGAKLFISPFLDAVGIGEYLGL